MIFSSFDFLLIFLPLTLSGFLLLRRIRSDLMLKVWLLASSLGFYGIWRLDYLPLLIGSICVNFVLGSYLQRNQNRNLQLLLFGLAFNLLLLGYYKYTAFVLSNVLTLIPIKNSGILTQWASSIFLPLGISFFTFQQIAYLVHSAARPSKIETPPSFIEYSLFVSFFPQLIAGPIVHHKQLVPQIHRILDAFTASKFAFGLSIFIIGLFKKALIADPLSPLVENTFASGAGNSFLDAWIGVIAYTYQIYFDFSGYADMAIGLAAMFGVKLPENFNCPYMAGNIRDFWRRWHMTLSMFLRDHIYIPLGGNRGSKGRVLSRILVTMILGGLWHGASWNFIIWGGYHGILIVLNHIFRRLTGGVNWWIGWPLTILSVVIGWVIFRSPDMESAIEIYAALFGLGNRGFSLSVVDCIPFEWWIACPLILFWKEKRDLFKQFDFRRAIFLGTILFLVLSRGGAVSEFLYFQF